MSEPRFNLVEDPWIPCLAPGTARPRELSLGELTERAGELTGIWCQSPLETAALHRLVTAVTHSALRGPARIAEGRALLADGKLPTEVGDYLKRWRERFELFDPERPFYQQVDPPDAKESPLNRIYHEYASANNQTLFDHHLDDDRTAVSPAEAARALVTHQAYALGGGVNKPFNLADAPLAGRLCVLPQGPTLAETIALCLVRYGDGAPIPCEENDAPAWEQDDPAEPNKAGSVPRGYLDYLTWQSRAIQIGPGERVVRCRYRQNLKLADDPVTIDPLVPYRKDDKRGLVFLRLRPDRALWRNLDAIIRGTLHKEIHPHGVLGWVAELTDAATPHGMLVAGITRDQAKVLHWSLARLPLTRRLLSDAQAREALDAAVSYATKGESALGRAVYRLAKLLVAPASEQPDAPPYDKDTVRKAVTALQPAGLYWPQLEPAFAALVERIGTATAGDATETATLEWAELVRRAADDALERVGKSLDGGRGLAAAARARQSLTLGLAELPRAPSPSAGAA